MTRPAALPPGRPRPLRRAVAVLASALLLGGVVAAQSAPASATGPRPATGTTSVRLIALNDLHGNLQPPTGSSGRVPLGNGSTVDAGGAAYLATHVEQLRAQVPRSVVLSSGDNIGASPLDSALFHDEPTIDVLNAIGLSASAVGNHEFDEGYKELLRIQTGGCNPVDGCQFDKPYRGAKFPYLGANVTTTKGLPALLPFTVTFVDKIPVGIIGVTLEDLPTVVTAAGIKGLKFGDEVQAINRTAAVLDRLGVKAQVVLLHQGDTSAPAGPDDCTLVGGGGPATAIARAATPRVDAFFTGHSHQAYDCTVNDPDGNPRPVIQGLSFGRLLSVVDLTLDRRTKDVVRTATVAHNQIVTRDVTPDPAVQAIVDRADQLSAPIANRRIGTITADLVKQSGPSGESPLGDVIADAQLEATAANGAQIAMTNPGGIRADLVYPSSPVGEGDGVVTYGEAFAVQPFANIMQTITLTGAQLKAVLEQQWQPQSDGSVRVLPLQISAGFSYSWSSSAPVGAKVSNLALDGAPVDPAASFRVSVNNFLTGGGDGFSTFTQGTDVTGGPIDLDALVAHLTAHPVVSPPPLDRVTVTP